MARLAAEQRQRHACPLLHGGCAGEHGVGGDERVVDGEHHHHARVGRQRALGRAQAVGHLAACRHDDDLRAEPCGQRLGTVAPHDQHVGYAGVAAALHHARDRGRATEVEQRLVSSHAHAASGRRHDRDGARRHRVTSRGSR